MTPEPRISRAAYLLGYAGLLPQLAAVLALALYGSRAADALPVILAYAYPSLILSFLGGVWWGFAMRRDRTQVALVVIAVLPSLAPIAIMFMTPRWTGVSLVLLGTAVLLTLFIDRHLVRAGDAPPNWMRLRAPLSLGLGGLTILAGLLAA